jgi:hypothetical protein
MRPHMAPGKSAVVVLEDRRMIRKTTANYESYLDSLLNFATTTRANIGDDSSEPLVHLHRTRDLLG